MKRASARNDRVTSKCLTHDTSATTEVAGAFKTRRHTKLNVASGKAQGEATWARVDSEPGAWKLGVAEAEERKDIRVIR